MSRRLLIRAGSLLRCAFTACAGMADGLYWPLELQEALADDPRVCHWCRRPYACDDDWASRRDAERMAADAEVFIADLLAGRIAAGDFAAPLR